MFTSKGRRVLEYSCLFFLHVQSGVSLGGRSGSYMVVSLCPSNYSRSALTHLAATSHMWLLN